MRILLTNDDGIDSAGLRQLLPELNKLGEVYVIAPEGERSSNSHHLTISGKLKYEEREVPGAAKAYALWGTPADCAGFGVCYMFRDQIDLVVSGINRGPNQSTDIIYSGTVAAAREAYMHGVPAIALSITDFHPETYAVAAEYGAILAEKFYHSAHNREYFLNVNVPYLPKEQIKGCLICDRMAVVDYKDCVEFIEEDGIKYAQIHPVDRVIHGDMDDLRIDIAATSHGYVSVTPLMNGHVCEEALKYIKEYI